MPTERNLLCAEETVYWEKSIINIRTTTECTHLTLQFKHCSVRCVGACLFCSKSVMEEGRGAERKECRVDDLNESIPVKVSWLD